MSGVPHITDEALDWALNHIEKYGDTDIFPKPFEFEAIRFNWDAVKEYIKRDVITKIDVKPHRRSLTPKNLFGFRPATQFDPIDSIIFLSLIYEVGCELEAKRISRNRNHSHSYRFQSEPDGTMFAPNFNWKSFRERTDQLCSEFQDGYIVVTDIADFYPRIYHHPLENLLDEAVSCKYHAIAIKNFIKSWNYRISYGIPVGSSGIRLLAELILDDIDKSIIADGLVFCRFVDDYRFFCRSKEEAYYHLSVFAHVIYENHSLTINQKKTQIMPISEYNKSRKITEEDKILNKLSEDFYELLDKLELSIDPYNGIEEDLDEETMAELEKLNMKGIFQDELKKGDDINLKLSKFIINRMKYLRDDSIVDIALENIEPLYPIFKELMVYIQSLDNTNPIKKNIIANKLLDIVNNSIISHLEYHKQWIFDTIFKLNVNLEPKLLRDLYKNCSDEFSKRKLILLKGQANDSTWFKLNKRTISNFGPWERRSFLYAAKCLPGDEYKNWTNSFKNNRAVLEESIVVLGLQKQNSIK